LDIQEFRAHVIAGETQCVARHHTVRHSFRSHDPPVDRKSLDMPLPKTPALTTDCVVFDNEGLVLLVRRARPPFKGYYALPGGFVDIGETVEQACRRELMEETGVKVGRLRLVGVYSDPKRDPRGHSCSVAFVTQLFRARAKAGDDAEAAQWVLKWSRLKLAFDHAKILTAAERMLAKEQF
jgi:8-oxo-dGTP diphosphatase